MVVTLDRQQRVLAKPTFEQFVDYTRKTLAQLPGSTPILSFSFPLALVDPLQVVGSLMVPEREHFYWEIQRQDLALAGMGHQAKIELQGSRRFAQARGFLDRCLQQITALGETHLPFAGPHFFCCFTFFDDNIQPDTPFAPATLFLPHWHLVRHQNQSVLVINQTWPRTQTLEAICDQVWQIKAEISQVSSGLASHSPGGNSQKNSSVSNGQITNSPIHNSPISNGTIHNSQISSSQVKNSLVVNSQIKDGLVSNSQISNRQISNSQISNSQVSSSDRLTKPHPNGYSSQYQSQSLAWIEAQSALSSASGGPIAALQPEQQGFKQQVSQILSTIAQGALSKVVLARRLTVTSAAPFEVIPALHNLRRLYPDCYLFSVGNGQGQSFLGASPERLLQVQNHRLYTEALAGSAPRGTTLSEDHHWAEILLSSSKERYEHQLVTDFIMQQLHQLGLTPQQAGEPSLLRLANIQHLQTAIEAIVPPQVHPLEIVAQLHPTPAVAGVPRDIACAQIRNLESFERSLYAAPLGWIDAQGNCEFIVGIRSALLDGAQAQLFAGAGVVQGSDPDREWAEVELKLQTLLNVL